MNAPYVDAHCHLVMSEDGFGENAHPYACVDSTRCVMSTNANDWEKLRKIEATDIVRSFGVHPWYCHLFSIGRESVSKREHYESVLECKERQEQLAIIERLPDPIPLEKYIQEEYDDELVGVIGEIGLDKLFRLPENGYFVHAKEPFRLTRVRVKLAHQIAVFERFCQLAAQFDKPVSVHDVKCHGKLFEICTEILLPHEGVNVCLHSFTGSKEIISQQWIRYFTEPRIFLSLSKYINFKSSEDGRALAVFVPNRCLLTETDLPIDAVKPDELTNALSYVCEELTEALQLGGLEATKQLIHTNFKRYLNR